MISLKTTVYLAGPITGLNYDQATDWREDVIKQLGQVGIKGLSPMRCKEVLKQFSVLSGIGKEYTDINSLTSSRGIMTRDFFDAIRCDVLLVNLLGTTRVSIGTVMEIAWAFQKKTPIVCAIEKSGNIHEHLMISEAIGFRVESLAEAVNVIKAILI